MDSPRETTLRRERVFPRPSERRLGRFSAADSATSFDHAADDLVIIQTSDDADVANPSGAIDGDSTWPLASLKAIGAIGGLISGLAFGILGFLEREDTLAGIVIVPVLTLLAASFAKRFVLPRTNATIAALVLAGFGARMLGAVPRLISGADSPIYQREGIRIADALRSYDFLVDTGRSIPGTGSVRYFTGVLNVLTGTTYIATFMIFVVLAFVGQVFFLFAIKPVLTTRQFQIAGLLIMFSPTMVYWPSSIGKESLALFGIGFALYGAGKVYDRRWSGLVQLTWGVLVVGMIRPHVAMLLLAALFVGLFARQAENKRRFAVHMVVLSLVVVGSMFTAGASARLFNLESFDGVADVSAALDFAEARTSQDSAAFSAARVGSVTDYPKAAVTVLFRPFVWEATNAPSLVSAIEGTFLGALMIYSLSGFRRQFKVVVQQGQLLFAVGFTAVFVFVFAAIGNFGILSRQRAQVIPFVLLLIAVGVGADKHRERKQERRWSP